MVISLAFGASHMALKILSDNQLKRYGTNRYKDGYFIEN